jgi:hypothetical protein|tara:strand:+ start:4100 stop:4618 length:519 start_codon:yes stop_codon:yes gene_type:complete
MSNTFKVVESIAEDIVEPVVEDITEYEPLFLSTVEILDRYWAQTVEVLQPCVDDAMNGEMTINDIYEGIKAGRFFCLIAKKDEGELPSVATAMILELIAYPQYTVMNITAIGGRELGLLRDRFWKQFCSWAYMNGVRTLQASVSPVMARMLKSYGFKPVYKTLRMSLIGDIT